MRLLLVEDDSMIGEVVLDLLRLRRKLGNTEIQTVRGLGYVMPRS